MTHSTPLASAIDRVLEVALGAVIGLAVSFVVFPSSAQRLMRRAAAATLDRMAEGLAFLPSGLREVLDAGRLSRLHEDIGRSLVEISGIAQEAERERRARLSDGPDTGPLSRTLLRLRHDLVMIGRVAATPLPAPPQARLAPTLDALFGAAGSFLTASAEALRAGRAPPPLAPVTQALETYGQEVEAVRREGLARQLRGDDLERLFAAGFALEQLHRNLGDLERVVTEWRV